MAQWIIQRTLNREVPGSNLLAAAVVPLDPHTLLVRFAPDSWVQHVAYIPIEHGSGLRSDAHCGTIRFALVRSGPHREVVHSGTLPDRFGTGTVRVQAPLWRGMVQIPHASGGRLNAHCLKPPQK